ncbi:MAG: glycyl-radical enzyme activating protein [Lachnospiraceae bacterium]|nr:glycyl-radical enzyme activating protein [Lachnospiraceae bacterium]MDD7051665.1 glycyl-radical enzyme activating protein [Lachnospiraceae bacterium]MDY4096341.1 glycyl-radical enzyme activating protein [Lachnospiraceae bacterium]
MEDDKKISGRIFDIQRYSIHDGVGIRTIVFLKGCALRCRWCCNPESQSFDIETMVINGKKKIMGKDVTVEEVMETVKRDMPYYSRSDGGLTLSGGESLLQPDFARGLLKAAKELGINTAMESMGFAKYETIASILPYLDVYLMDIKHMNPSKHADYTQKSNELMLENARKIAASGQTELIIRVPVIPGFNDTEEEILDIARFADSLPGVKQIHLLPYHSFGRGKYEGLGREYPMGEAVPPSNEKMQQFKERVARNTALYCQIGG